MQILGKTGGSQRPQGQQEDVLPASLRSCFLIFPENSRGTAGGELGRKPLVSLFSTTACVSSQNVTEFMVYLPLLARGM